MQRHDEKLFPVCFASKKLSRMPSDCMGNQEILSIFVQCTFCAADRPRAAEVHGQRKIYQRTTHAMGSVSTKLQFQGESH